MLGRIERTTKVEYDDWRWKVSYALPLHGKDYWTTKMEKIEAEKDRESVKQMESMKQRKGSNVKRFSWKRKSVKIREKP